MLFIFRKLRRSFFQPGKVRTYFAYAAGEIVLIVVGILIALQISNWNEERKDLKTGHEILHEIKENIEFNTDRFREEIEEEQAVIHSIDIVLDNIYERKGYDESLDFHYLNVGYWPYSARKSSGYDTLLSQGVELIRSTELRQAIIDLYERTYEAMSENRRISEDNSAATNVPILTDLFFTQPTIPNQPFKTLRLTPFDYDEVVKSQKYKGYLSFWRHTRTVALQSRLNAIKEHEGVIELINHELKTN